MHTISENWIELLQSKKLWKRGGFTLIELIVVFAIISILVAFIVAYLDHERHKGGNAAIISNMTNSRAQADLYFTNSGTYEGVCLDVGASTIGRFVKAAERAYSGGISVYDDSTASTWSSAQCHDTIGSYAIWIPNRESTMASPLGWCTDNKNEVKSTTFILPPGAFECP